jgi:biofilm PGA synthesis N-glycosyltransferase PgaC
VWSDLFDAASRLCLGYLVLVYALSIVLLVASTAEHWYRTRQSRTRADSIVAASPLTMPVSVVAPMFNEAYLIAPVVQSLLDFNYPEFEVIVVSDGSTDRTLDVLRDAFALEPQARFYRRRVATAEVRGVYVSRREPRLIVIDKAHGGKADALNCGLNFARFPYICSVDGDTIYSPAALLNGMRPVLDDPLLVIGVTSAVAVSRSPQERLHSRPGPHRIDYRIRANFELLDFLRAFLNGRLGSARWGFMLCASGAFAIWRRDVLQELGGFSPAFTCEDIEFTFRVHESFRRLGRPYRIVALTSVAGCTESPATLGNLISQRARWQRVILETLWSYRRMFLNPRYGSVGIVGVPHYVLTEGLAPFFETLAVAVTVGAWWSGVLDLRVVQLLITVAFANAVLTNAAIILHDVEARRYPLSNLAQLILQGPIDLFVYRPVIFVAQLKGLVDFLSGRKGWDKFPRSPLPATASDVLSEGSEEDQALASSRSSQR